MLLAGLRLINSLNEFSWSVHTPAKLRQLASTPREFSEMPAERLTCAVFMPAAFLWKAICRLQQLYSAPPSFRSSACRCVTQTGVHWQFCTRRQELLPCLLLLVSIHSRTGSDSARDSRASNSRSDSNSQGDFIRLWCTRHRQKSRCPNPTRGAAGASCVCHLHVHKIES